MIINIPPPQDFNDSGLSLLNFAWDTVISLLTTVDDAEDWEVDVVEVSDAYWEASKQHLLTSLAVAQQGIEFIIKARISDVSPFLLISGSPRNWPKKCDKEDVSYAEFRAVDAQDLLKVYNTCSKEKFDEEFVNKFEELRKKRNSIVHTIDKRINLHALEIIAEILFMHKYLFPEDSWVKTRRKFVEESPISELGGTDFSEHRIILEFSLLAEKLKPSETKNYFNFNKNQRQYICPVCKYEARESQLTPRTALLKPNTSRSKNLYCFICDDTHEVIRESCENEVCKGNVISEEYGICCTCGDSQG